MIGNLELYRDHEPQRRDATGARLLPVPAPGPARRAGGLRLRVHRAWLQPDLEGHRRGTGARASGLGEN